jgi:hypothetical protein
MTRSPSRAESGGSFDGQVSETLGSRRVSVIYHIATGSDWVQARADGEYTTSTRGRTLAEQGFIHASTAARWRQWRT